MNRNIPMMQFFCVFIRHILKIRRNRVYGNTGTQYNYYSSTFYAGNRPPILFRLGGG